MNCKRCRDNRAEYRARTDKMNIEVCEACAREARRLGIAVQVLQPQTNVVRLTHGDAMNRHTVTDDLAVGDQ